MAFPHIDTPSGGLLNAADLDMARRESTGQIYALREGDLWRESQIPAGYGYGTDDCAPECAQHHDPVATATHRPALGLALVLLAWPTVAAIVGVVAWVLR